VYFHPPARCRPSEKCIFDKAIVEFLGKVSAAGVEPMRRPVQEVLAHPEPTTISKLQAFLGTINSTNGSCQRQQGSSSHL
jgi:hypothetical protein